MDEDKTTSQTQDEVPAEQSAAETTTTDEQVNLDNVDPRLVVEDAPEAETETETEPEQPAKEQPAEEQPAEETPAEQPAPVEPPAEAPVSRRENKRIVQLTNKLKEAGLSPSRPSQPQQPSPVIGEGDYSLEQVNELAAQHGDQRYTEGVKEANTSTLFLTRLEIDAPKVESKFPQLNPQSDEFDPGAADLTTQLYYKVVGLKTKPDGTFSVDNPNVRYSEFIDAYMESVDALAASKQADSQTNLAKQAAKTGARPSNQVAKSYAGDDPNKMTTEQLRAKVNQELGIA